MLNKDGRLYAYSDGGYPVYYVTADCSVLCSECANAGHVGCSQRDSGTCYAGDKGACIVAVDVNWEDSMLSCDECSKRIESAYADDDVCGCGEIHADYPHEPGYLDSCGACRAACHCGPGVATGTETECFAAEHDDEKGGL